jgi:prolyl 4-hydroxylase
MAMSLRTMSRRRLILFCIIILTSVFVTRFLLHKSYKTRIVKHRFKEGYEVWEIYNLLTPTECKDLMQYAETKGLDNSYVWSYNGESQNVLDTSHRKSKQSWVSDQEHPVAMKLAKFTEEITGIPQSHQEHTQVARYDIMGKFNDHYDACEYKDPEYCAKMNNNAGERRTTLLVYLNKDFKGGETEFPLIGFKSTPVVGKAILFWNVDNDEKILPLSKHRGNQVIGGNKWIATKWSHSKPYNNSL